MILLNILSEEKIQILKKINKGETHIPEASNDDFLKLQRMGCIRGLNIQVDTEGKKIANPQMQTEVTEQAKKRFNL